MATVPVRLSSRGLCRVILGPWAPCTVTLAVVIMSFWSPVSLFWIKQLSKETHCMRTELMVLVICKTLRQNLRFYLGFSVYLWVFHFILFWKHFSIYNEISFVMLKNFTDVRWKKWNRGEKNPTTVRSCPKVEHSMGEEKGSTQLLKSSKSPSPEFSLVGWHQGKKTSF